MSIAKIDVPTPARIHEMMNKNAALIKHLLYLTERWADERAYEDIKDYEKSIREKMKAAFPDLLVLRATKRPFGFVYRTPDKYEVHVRFLLKGGKIEMQSQYTKVPGGRNASGV